MRCLPRLARCAATGAAVMLTLASASALWPQTAQAQILLEQEPNDTFATATPLIPDDPLGGAGFGYSGTLTMGDVDVFSMVMIPNAEGRISFSYDSSWSAMPPGAPALQWLHTRHSIEGFSRYVFVTHRASGGRGSTTSSSWPFTEPVRVFFELFSTTFANSQNMVPSQVPGSYRIENVRALEGSQFVSVIPEPSSLALLLCGGTGGAGLLLRRRNRPRRARRHLK